MEDTHRSNQTYGDQIWDLVLRTYDLGFTSFGGPPSHFHIFHRRFVEEGSKRPWIDEQTYLELFAICQALPGPASTKMFFCIALLRAGFLAAMLAFLIWSLPGAIAMFSLAIGVRRIGEVLPAPAYALLSGLNAATVGIIAVAAVQLARKAITDPLSRLLVTLGGCAGVCYNALWYFPTIMVLGGSTTLIWDCWLRAKWGRFLARRQQARQSANPSRVVEENEAPATDITSRETSSIALVRRNVAPAAAGETPASPATPRPESRISVVYGLVIIVVFFAMFAGVMVARALASNAPRTFQLFSNMFLAGTVIFGGGPVVIPLLREYVVQPGWVSPRDFLIGLAIIQACPGPNFNFAVFLGALTLPLTPASMALGALIGFSGIFAPGLILSVGFQSLWRALRSKPAVVSILRGINATAVGLVFTAVYRLWEIGYLTVDEGQGISLGKNPWWVAVTAGTFVMGDSFGVPAAVAILSGGVLGLAWWGVVGARGG
ncbi:hypothetical protein BDN72DRAFT_867800 [Pluteus cervinus]|uniref:Uncharacterized protein n=1 Tax=Pluteus cervinus TaxID=181527 RepID=A0ACD3BE59_9AGAR|nr:hypothetical protein BDN72DRAFT_867800 [Pluteus cervinus]